MASIEAKPMSYSVLRRLRGIHLTGVGRLRPARAVGLQRGQADAVDPGERARQALEPASTRRQIRAFPGPDRASRRVADKSLTCGAPVRWIPQRVYLTVRSGLSHGGPR